MTSIETPDVGIETPVALIETPAVCKVVIDGREMRQRVSSVVLHQFIDRHHVLKVSVLQEGEGSSESDFGDPSSYTAFLGKTVAVTISPANGAVDASREMEFVGVVTEVSVDNSIDRLNTVVITAQSPTVALDGSPQVTLFEEQTASDIIGLVVSGYPISTGTMESTSTSIPYCVQHYETDYQFVMRLAEGASLFAYYDGKEFKSQKANGSSPEALVWCETLGKFAFGLGTTASKFASKSWDYTNKAEVEGESDSSALQSSPSDLARISIDASNQIYSKAGFVEASKATDQSGIDSTLGVRVEGRVGQMVRCVGESIVPSVKVGQCVKVEGMAKLDGLFWVTEVKHVFDDSGKYHNKFVSSPLDVAFPAKKTARPSVTKLQTGTVVDLDDPEAIARIKVNLPALGIDSSWIRYVSPHAGSERGIVTMPEVGDEVLVGFVAGNPDLPIALGSLYNGGPDKPPVVPDNKNETKVFLTKGGNEIRITDTSGSEEIKIINATGENTIVLEKGGPSISIESKGDISITATGDISLKGANIKLEADQGIELKSMANTKVEATGQLALKGTGGVDVDSAAILNIKGSLVKIN